MSKYANQSEFISRTLKILRRYEKECEFEKTLFLNSCLSLLIIPQQAADHYDNIRVDGVVDYENWGIDAQKIKSNNHKKGINANSVENIAYHFRNSLCHYRFDIMEQNTEKIERIQIVDMDGKVESFHLDLSFDDFKKFILKYANELKKKLESL